MIISLFFLILQAKKVVSSPLKYKHQDLKNDDNTSSQYDNNSILTDKDLTPLNIRKNRLAGHSTLVSMDHNGSPMTTLLKNQQSRYQN